MVAMRGFKEYTPGFTRFDFYGTLENLNSKSANWGSHSGRKCSSDPQIEYAQAWSPHLNKDISLLESVQRRATKLLDCIAFSSYEDRLEFLNLYLMQY